MAQLSRPYQIAFVAMAFLVLVWFVALRGHSPSSSSSASARAPTVASQAKAAAPTPIYHGAAPGVEGLTRAIAKAHGAVATSQQNAKELQEKSAQASGQSTATTTPSTTVTHSSQAVAPASTPATASKSAARTQVKPHKATASGTPAQQKAVESELKGGKVVLLLFWNPKASVDVAVHKELQAVGRKLGGKIAVHDAEAKQVGSFGSITQAIQVYQTPTILLVNRHGVTTTLTGLTDVYSLEQTIEEARHA